MDALTLADPEAIDQLYQLFQAPRLRCCPLIPTPRQQAFLMLDDVEVFYGGAAAGGKSAALLMSALQYADVPGYDALILRRSLAELRLPGNMIELSHEWLTGTPAVWNGELNRWQFPGRGRSGADGATLCFGYLADNGDRDRYAGSSFSYVAFDELTRFPEPHYRYMQRVLRNPSASHKGQPAADGTRLGDVPVRIRSASNPGGEHHEWVKHRFVNPETRAEGAIFLPSRLRDNPHIDQEMYAARLAALPPAERERLLHGNWEIPDDGEVFERVWFMNIERHQLPKTTRKIRYWDLAASEPSAANPDPDWTVGLRLEQEPTTGIFYVTDIVRVRKAAGAVEQLVRETAERDGREVAIVVEQDGGGAGKALTSRYTREILRGFNVRAHRPTGSKELRARPVAAAAENGYICVVRGRNTDALLDECSSFPHGRHDDCVDALAGAHHHVSRLPQSGRRTTSVPRGRIPNVNPPRRRYHSTGQDAVEQFASSLGARVYDMRSTRPRI